MHRPSPLKYVTTKAYPELMFNAIEFLNDFRAELGQF